MSVRIKHANWPSLMMLGLIVAILGYQALASRAPEAVTAQPNLIATFDLYRTFKSLDEKKQADAELLQLKDELVATLEARMQTIKQMEEELALHQPGSPKHRELTEQWARASHEHQADAEFYQLKQSLEAGRRVNQIFSNITKAAEQLAKERGYAVVFVKDYINEIRPGTEDEVERQNLERRMIYIDPDVDITDELIRRMNQSFQATRN